MYIIEPDECGTEYKYSDELFDWFYSRLKLYSCWGAWDVADVDLKATRDDNSANGCRIWLKDGCYLKFCEYRFMLEFTYQEWDIIHARVKWVTPKLSDIVDYFYNSPKPEIKKEVPPPVGYF